MLIRSLITTVIGEQHMSGNDLDCSEFHIK